MPRRHLGRVTPRPAKGKSTAHGRSEELPTLDGFGRECCYGGAQEESRVHGSRRQSPRFGRSAVRRVLSPDPPKVQRDSACPRQEKAERNHRVLGIHHSEPSKLKWPTATLEYSLNRRSRFAITCPPNAKTLPSIPADPVPTPQGPDGHGVHMSWSGLDRASRPIRAPQTPRGLPLLRFSKPLPPRLRRGTPSRKTADCPQTATFPARPGTFANAEPCPRNRQRPRTQDRSPAGRISARVAHLDNHPSSEQNLSGKRPLFTSTPPYARAALTLVPPGQSPESPDTVKRLQAPRALVGSRHSSG